MPYTSVREERETGCIGRWVSRTTETLVEVYDGANPSAPFTDKGGRWVNKCEHGATLRFQTKTQALHAAHRPDQWCRRCTVMGTPGTTADRAKRAVARAKREQGLS